VPSADVLAVLPNDILAVPPADILAVLPDDILAVPPAGVPPTRILGVDGAFPAAPCDFTGASPAAILGVDGRARPLDILPILLLFTFTPHRAPSVSFPADPPRPAEAPSTGARGVPTGVVEDAPTCDARPRERLASGADWRRPLSTGATGAAAGAAGAEATPPFPCGGGTSRAVLEGVVATAAATAAAAGIALA
jgi:hypothetical protein